MKKLTLFLVAMLFSALSFAALNPYAYGLTSTFEDNTLKVNYSLNADATGVSVVILNGETEVHTVACNDKKNKGSHSVNIDISTLGLPTGKSLTWKVVVTGNSVASPTIQNDKFSFYLPYGLDCDVDPESDYLGNWYVIEAARKSSNQTHSGYHSYEPNKNVRGLYAFDASLTPIKNNSGYYVFYGGMNVGGTETNINNDYLNFYRVATSGGRVFIGRFRDGDAYHPIVEANPADLNATFTSVFTSGRAVSIDARGSGENLKLVMLAKDNNIYEYDLGTAKSIAAASRTIKKGNLSIVRDDATITYDTDGDIWFNQNQSSPTANQPTIARLSIENGFDYSNVSAGVTHANTNNSGIAVSPDGKKMAVVGAGTKTLTIYNISKTDGQISLTKAHTISTAGSNHTALSWDYAGNLYVANRSAETIQFYAMPYSGTVATPCASKYAFSLPAPPQLNPFAYKLSSELSADEKTLTINYSLNALATSVNWVLMDGETPIKTIDLAYLGLAKGDYTTKISTTDFPQYKQLTWKIEVKGVAVGEPTEVGGYRLFHPSGVDIDNNPENKNFGLILTNEALHRVNQQTSTYLGAQFGSGIFAFNAAFEPIKNGTKPGFNGGNTFTHVDDKHYPVRRVRITEDGRIFVTGQDNSGNYLWEVNPDNLDKWTSVFQGTKSDYKLTDASNKFIVGTNSGFDVRGSGENLQLLMLSGAVSGNLVTTFKLHEYNIGAKTTWSSTPTRELPNCQLHSSMITNQSQVLYDNEGGYWITYWVNTNASNLGGIAHFTKEGTEDFSEDKIYMRNAGIRFNNDYTKLVIATSDITGASNTYKHATIYAVSKGADGKPKLTKETTIDMTTVGSNLNDFAWDYANNIYAVGNSGEWICAYAMPHSSEDVVATPAASKYAFSIGKYTVTVNTNDVNKGTVTGGGEYGAGAVVTLTATPKEGYELLYWSDRSKENPRTITVDGNEALSAYFIKKNDVEPTFSITKVWENIAEEGSSTNNGYQGAGWDGKIYVKDRYGDKILVYSETGSSPYVEFGGSYEGLAGDQAITMDDAGNMIIRSGSAFFYDAPSQISIFKKGETTYKTIDFTLPVAERCDFISASGNVYSAEGGYVYFYCKNANCVNRLKITNGAATTSDVSIDVIGNITAEITNNTQSHVMVDIFGNLVTHARTFPITTTINAHTGETMNFTLPNDHKAIALGGCSFELAGKEFWAFNVKGTNICNSEWNLYNLTDGKFESSETLYAKNKTDKNSAANWLNVQVVDEKTAYIYQFCPTVGAAMWKVTRDHIVSATAENGTVEGAGTYKDNATATLTATANDGYVFKNWTKNGAEVITENPYSFTVTEDVELVANFDGPFCELILNTNDEAKGTVSGAGFYNVGQTVTIKATPKPDYKLLYWSDRSTENPRTITMNKKEALSAYFVKVYDEEPTFAIEKVWENTQVPGSADGYQAVGWDGNIYMQNKTAGKIKVYTNDTDAAVDYATSNTSGQQIAVDEVGNLIVFNATFYTITPNAITIYQKGSTTGKDITFTLPYPKRCDFISASGDIYSAEGGYVYFYCETQKVVNRVKIINGELAAVDAIGNTANPATSTSHVMVDIFGNLAAHCRSTAVYSINSYTGETTAFNTSLSGIKLSTLGGCSFELGGKELWAYNVGTTHYNSEWNLYNMTDGEFLSDETLYAKDRTSKKATGPANWLNVQVVDEKTAYIYQFCPEVAVAVWKVTLVETVVIDDKADNTTALAEYNGQKVTAKVTRAFNNDSYKTLTLPFDMDAEQIKAVFGETAKVYKFTTVVEGNDALHLQFESTTSIVAGTPYIIDLPDGDYDAKDGFTIENVEIDLSLNPINRDVITMEPVLDGGDRLDEAGQYWLSADNFLYNAGNYPTALLGLRAYFTSSSSMPIRARVVFDENQATSIPVVVAPENNVRKVMKNGQLIIIRGEQKYNIQGQRME